MVKPNGSPETHKPAEQHHDWVLVKDSVLMQLAKRAAAFVMKKRLSPDGRKFVEENVDELRAIRNAVSNLEPYKYRGLRSWYQAYGVDGAVQYPVGKELDGGGREYVDCSSDMLWCFFGAMESQFFGAWLRLLDKTGNRQNNDLNRVRLANMKEVVRVATEKLRQPTRTATITSVEDVLAEGANPFLLIRGQAVGNQQESLERDIETVQKRIDWIVSKQLDREAKKEVDTTAQAQFGGEEEEVHLPSPTEVRAEAVKEDAEAKAAGNAGDYGKAAMHQAKAKQLRADADKLENELAEAEKAVIAAELAEVPLIATTATEEAIGPNHGEVSLTNRGVTVKEVPVEMPETLEAQAKELDAKKAEAVAAENYSAAQSFAERSKKLRAKVGELRAEAGRQVAKAAAAQQAKIEPPVTTSASAATPAPQTEKSEKARRRAERRAVKAQPAEATPAPATAEQPATPSPASENPLKVAAKRFALGEISFAEFQAVQTALGQ